MLLIITLVNCVHLCLIPRTIIGKPHHPVFIMKTKTMCLCCIIRTPTWDLKTPYTRPGLGVPEVYSDMLVTCFDIHLTLDTDDECGICEECVGRLRDASDFKLQVQRSQAELREELERALQVKDEDPLLPEMADGGAVSEETILKEEPEVKSERWSEEHETGDEMWQSPVKSELSDNAASDEDSATLGCGDMFGSGALSRAVSARARQQLAMTCSVRLERLHQGRICHSAADQESTLTTHMEEMHTDSAAVRAEEEACTCDTCGERFTDKMDLVDHVQKQKHMETSHSCQLWSKSFSNKCMFAEYSHTQKAPIASNDILTSVSNLNKQGVIQAERKPFSCNICNKSFKRKQHLSTHMKIHSGQKPYICDICNQRFTQNFSLTKHMKIHTGQKPHKCDICKRRFRENSDLTKHIRRHTGQKTYECEICNEKFHQKGHLSTHMIIHPGHKAFKCHICNKQFDRNSNLNKHIKIHTGQKPYTCDICNKQFAQKGHLTTHIKTHTGLRPYKCEICNKLFKLNSNLNKHIKIHTGQKPYQCEICTHQFIRKEHLNRHIRVHSGQKPYKCEICNKRFPRKETLKSHMTLHTGQRPYECDICNKQFICKEHLKRHIRLHTDQKPYKCEICDKRFPRKEALNNHIILHTGQKPYKCDTCNKQFTRRDRLECHVSSHSVQK